jgi:hypothetical protein
LEHQRLPTRRPRLRDRPRIWRIDQVNGRKLDYLGTVAAPDKGSALQKAYEKFGILDLERQGQLVAREL